VKVLIRSNLSRSYRRIASRAAAPDEVFRHVTHQRLADPGYTRLRVYRQGPQAGAAHRVGKCLDMVDAGRSAEDLPAFDVRGDKELHGARGAVVPHEIDRWRNHLPRQVDPVHGCRLRAAVEQVHRVAARAQRRDLVAVQPQAVGVRGVEEQVLRLHRQQHMRVIDIEGNVALAG